MQTLDEIAWARRVNGQWIVREGFRQTAADYLDLLEADDPDRLSRSCLRARQMLDLRERTEDPKPWFYAGLFSLTKPEEAERFLRGRDFTLACLPHLEGLDLGSMNLETVSLETLALIARIRTALGTLT